MPDAEPESLLLTVTGYVVEGSGLLVVEPEFEHPAAEGQLTVRLQRPDGSSSVTGASSSRPFVIAHPYAPPGLVCAFRGLTRKDVPIGTEVWLIGKAEGPLQDHCRRGVMSRKKRQ